MSGVLFQYFEWFMDLENDLWNRLKEDAPRLREKGISAVWLPPPFKSTSPFDTGYGVYDLYDLGEFDQKGSVKTKYGSKDELLACIDALHEQGMQVYADVVLNHKANGDETEKFMVREMDPNDRTKAVSEPYEIEAWTKFTFPGRGDKYSAFKWSWIHFSGTDYNAANGKRAVYMIKGINKGWSQGVTYENGNFDYLMFNDIDYKHPDVLKEIRNWARWFVNETGVDGFRFDAVKHINDFVIRDLIRMIRAEYKEDFYALGEYWDQRYEKVNGYLESTDHELDLLDVKLHFNFHEASRSFGKFDMRKIFDGTLVQKQKSMAVTFVDNHDSQPGQSLESWVEPWFKPLAYALILLRRDGYPVLFYGDYYGIAGEHPIEGHQDIIDKLLHIRMYHAHGEQNDYFDHENVVGWVRMGDDKHPHGMVCIMSDGYGGEKQMNVGELNKGAVYADYTGNIEDKVTIDADGNGVFRCHDGSMSIWVRDDISPEEAVNEEAVSEEPGEDRAE